jgi:hypothetical protein
MRSPAFTFVSSLLVFVAASALSANAGAQVAPNNGAGIDTHLFRPAVDGNGFFSVNGADVTGAGSPAFALVIDYGRGLLRTSDARKDGARWLVDHSFQATAQVDYGIADVASIGLAVPVDLVSGPEQDANGKTAEPTALWSPNALSSHTLGNVALHAKARVARESADGAPISAAFVVRTGVPVTDAPTSGAADPGLSIWPELVLEKRFGDDGQLRIGVEAGARMHSSNGTRLVLRGGDSGVVTDGPLFTYGAGASLRVAEPLDLVAESYGTLATNDTAPSERASNEAVFGLKLYVEKSSYLMVGGGTRLTSGYEAADARAFVGFVFTPEKKTETEVAAKKR